MLIGPFSRLSLSILRSRLRQWRQADLEQAQKDLELEEAERAQELLAGQKLNSSLKLRRGSHQ